MSKKIILFLSALRDNNNPEEIKYNCPDGTIVTGKQTNEAPVKHLLNKYNDISEIICIVTKEAKEKGYDVFKNTIKQLKPSVSIKPIRFFRGDFFVDIQPKIIAKIQSDDEIFIETTGGKRDNIINIILLSRALTYSKIKIVEATYGDMDIKRKTGKIIYITNQFKLFDFMSGMQELKSFGDVKQLKEYYADRNTNDETISGFLNAVDNMFEDIVFCRTAKIKNRLDEFNKSLDMLRNNKSTDHLFDAMFSTFKEIFGEEKKLSIGQLIKWCLKNGMVQQALTIYTEKMPEEILNIENGLFSRVPAYKGSKQKYEDENAKLFYEVFLTLAENGDDFRSFYKEKTSLIREYIMNNSKIKFDKYSDIIDNIKIIGNLYYDNDGKLKPDYHKKKFTKDKEYLKAADFGAKNGSMANTKEGFINSISSAKNEDIIVLFEKSQYGFVPKDSNNIRIKTIEEIDDCIAESGFEFKCSSDVIKNISRDYIYIKIIRNMVNHANTESSQDELIAYLLKSDNNRYKNPENINIYEIKKIVESAIDRVYAHKS